MQGIKRQFSAGSRPDHWKTAVAGLGLVLVAGCAAAPTPPQAARRAIVRTEASPDFANCAKPAYPDAARQAQHTGTVTLALLVGVDGKLADSKIVKSSGYRALDVAARDGFARCTYHPATVDGSPEMSWLSMQYVWTLPAAGS